MSVAAALNFLIGGAEAMQVFRLGALAKGVVRAVDSNLGGQLVRDIMGSSFDEDC
jgi:hypothetical protein